MKVVILTAKSIASRVRGRMLKRQIEKYFPIVLCRKFSDVAQMDMTYQDSLVESMAYQEIPFVVLLEEQAIKEYIITGSVMRVLMDVKSCALIFYNTDGADMQVKYANHVFRIIHRDDICEFLTVETGYNGERIMDTRFQDKSFYLEKEFD